MSCWRAGFFLSWWLHRLPSCPGCDTWGHWLAARNHLSPLSHPAALQGEDHAVASGVRV